MIRVSAFVVVFAAAGAAVASSNYPAALRDHLDATSVPSCTACHETNAGGSGTVVQAFGVAMLDAGLVGGGDTASLTAALDALEADNVDSDGDGTGDVDELRAGQDPNVAGGVAATPVGYGFGCSTTPTVEPVALLGALALLLRRRR
jgi:MYXO-CTERM domain-containing protein